MAERPMIAGMGATPYGRLPDADPYLLGIDALALALADAGLGKGELDALVVSRIPDYQRFGEVAGIDPGFCAVLPGQGRMAGISMAMGAALIQSGTAETVALVYASAGLSEGSRYGGATDRYGSGGAGLWFPWGMTSPGAVHAMMFRQHMARYGTTTAQLGEIAVTFRTHAVLNPGATKRTPITLDDHANSRFIADPLRLLDYCLISDGAVALILTTAERARDLRRKPVAVLGWGAGGKLSGSAFPPDDFWFSPMRAAAQRSYAMAGFGPEAMSGVMAYDNFTPAVLFGLEGCGYCAQGEGGPFVGSGPLRLGGTLPGNTSGGHLSEGYLQGWSLLAEAVRQLRQEAGERQISDAKAIHYLCASPVSTSVILGAA
jgi:acetyl-CoA acetyltransferase